MTPSIPPPSPDRSAPDASRHAASAHGHGRVAAAPWRLERAAHGRLDFTAADGTRHVDVDVLRGFPVSAPAGPVAVVAADGTELAWIESLADLEPPVRGMLESELSQREFRPLILRIESVSDGEPTEWSVVTDRGPRRFTVAHADDVAYTSDGGAFVTDTVGVRYHIAQVSRLDGRSRRLLVRME
jgi:hypothetical protein